MDILLALSVYVTLSTGQLSLGNAGFMAIGAYLSAVLTLNAKLPLIPALMIGGLAAAAIGVLVGFPALRLRGFYLTMATVGFGEMVRTFFLNFSATGGALGLRGMSGTTPELIWICVAVALVGFYLHSKSRLALAMQAVRDDEVAAGLMGLPVIWIKVGAFGFGAFLAGFTGGLYAHYSLFIDSNMFGVGRSIEMALLIILGGMNTFWGSIVGAGLLVTLPEMLRFLKDWRGAFFGGLLVLILIASPGGILSSDWFRFIKKRTVRRGETSAGT